MIASSQLGLKKRAGAGAASQSARIHIGYILYYGTYSNNSTYRSPGQYHFVSKQTPRRPFGLLLLACLTAAAGGCPAAQAHTSSRRPCRSPPTSAKTVAKGEATSISISHRAARYLDLAAT